MQAWGASSRFTIRDTRREPTKSGVIGLLAAALGRRRGAELVDLAALKFGVRIDQPGSVMRDFHTTQTVEGRSLPLSQRYYIADGAFLAAVEGEDGFIRQLHRAVEHPQFPLFLGRRGCPAVTPVSLGIRAGHLAETLGSEPWLASPWYRKQVARQVKSPEVILDVVRDAELGEVGESVRDVPLNFDPVYRRYAWRDTVRERIPVRNPEVALASLVPVTGSDPDWIAVLGGHDVSV